MFWYLFIFRVTVMLALILLPHIASLVICYFATDCYVLHDINLVSFSNLCKSHNTKYEPFLDACLIFFIFHDCNVFGLM